MCSEPADEDGESRAFSNRIATSDPRTRGARLAPQDTRDNAHTFWRVRLAEVSQLGGESTRGQEWQGRRGGGTRRGIPHRPPPSARDAQTFRRTVGAW
jgi:hypothetical protein